MKEELIKASEQSCYIHRRYSLCWSAIIAGALVGIGLAFLLHMYGLALGLSAYSSVKHTNAIEIGGFLGLLIGVIAAMGTAGFVSGYLGRHHYHKLHGGVIYGFVTWSLIILLSAVIERPLVRLVDVSERTLSANVVMEQENTDNNAAAPKVTTKSKALKAETANAPVADASAKQMAMGGWIIFALFFIGALSSCIGACYGINCKRENYMNDEKS